MKILFIGGTGIISSACSPLCIKQGHELYLLNRGKSIRTFPQGAIHLNADINDLETVRELISEHHFDAIVDWIAYTPADVERDYSLFRDKTSQFVFISSASAYAKPPQLYLKETDELYNPYWVYSQNKIHCENYLTEVYERSNFPVTIVRPSHTYDKTKIPLQGGYTAFNRMLNGQPVIVHGDGTSWWTLTHHDDFARGFLGILGNKSSIGEAYHITGDEILTWNEIYQIMAATAGVEAQIVHISSEMIYKYDKDWGDGLLGDKSFSLVFDNSKIQQFVPDMKTTISFREGAEQIVEWHREDPSRGVINSSLNEVIDQMIEKLI